MTFSNIAKALMSDNPADRDAAIDREVLEHAVIRTIFCTATGEVLDKRTAVMITITTSGGESGATVITGKHWDTVKDTVIASCLKKNATLEVLDGRVLFGDAK